MPSNKSEREQTRMAQFVANFLEKTLQTLPGGYEYGLFLRHVKLHFNVNLRSIETFITKCYVETGDVKIDKYGMMTYQKTNLPKDARQTKLEISKEE